MTNRSIRWGIGPPHYLQATTFAAVKRNRLFSELFTWGLYAYVLFLPLSMKVLPIFIGILIVSFAFSSKSGDIKTAWLSWSLPQKGLLLSMPLFYLFHLLGMAWSQDMDFALLDIGIKVSLFLLPLLLLFRPLSRHLLQRLMRLFVLGLLLSVVWNIILSAIVYWKIGDVTAFQGSNFSHTLHIGYYAMYLLVGIAILIHGMFSIPGWRKLIGPLFAAFVLAFALILTASKMGAIILLVIVAMAVVHYIRRRGEWKIGLIAFLGLIAICTAVFMSAGTLRHRLTVMWERTFHSPLEPDSVESTMARRMTWDATWTLFQSSPLLGTGTGDIKNELVATYNDKGYLGPAGLRLNSHQQYLQSYAALGLFGGSILLFAMLGLVFFAWRSAEFLVIGGSLAIALSLITESILEVQAGVLFVGVMLPLLVHWMRAQALGEVRSE